MGQDRAAEAGMGDDRLLLEITLPAPLDVVWRALRDPDEIQRWFGWEYDGLTAEVKYIFADEAVEESATVLSFNSSDRFVLEPAVEETVLRVTRPALAEDIDWDNYYDDIDTGWTAFVEQLRFALSRHAGQERRTLFLTGGATDESAHLPHEELGLAPLVDKHVGDRYEATLATGEAITGEMWFRAGRQFGVTVDEYGDGLIVVGGKPIAAAPPYGGAEIIVTTYGQDDATFAEVKERWARWWHDRYTTAEGAEKWGAL